MKRLDALNATQKPQLLTNYGFSKKKIKKNRQKIPFWPKRWFITRETYVSPPNTRKSDMFRIRNYFLCIVFKSFLSQVLIVTMEDNSWNSGEIKVYSEPEYWDKDTEHTVEIS